VPALARMRSGRRGGPHPVVLRCYTVVVDDDVYDGIPVDELPIIAADVPDRVHLRRSVRYPGARDVDPDAAVEAALDPDGLVARDSSSRTGEAILVVGYTQLADEVLVVVLLPDDHPPTGLWHVVTAWPADRRRRRAYWIGEDR
jgi:hypothetical protein